MGLFEERMIRIILSQPKKKDQQYQKVTLKWISDKKRSGYQVESFTSTQVFHRFVAENDLMDELVQLSEDFKQVHAFTENEEAALKISKKGKIFVMKQALKQKRTVDLLRLLYPQGGFQHVRRDDPSAHFGRHPRGGHCPRARCHHRKKA